MSLSDSQVVASTVAERPDPSLAPTVEVESALPLQSLLDDHSELRGRVVRLRKLCAAQSGNQEPAVPVAAALIEEFAYLLIAHFAAEQASEFLENGSRSQPQMLQRVERLQTEHVQIAAALRQVLEFCQTRPRGHELSNRLTHILDMFDAHERAEKAVIQELVLLDEGGGGE